MTWLTYKQGLGERKQHKADKLQVACFPFHGYVTTVGHKKTNKVMCAQQGVHSACKSAIWSVFAGHSIGSKRPAASSNGQWRVWLDCVDAQADQRFLLYACHFEVFAVPWLNSTSISLKVFQSCCPVPLNLWDFYQTWACSSVPEAQASPSISRAFVIWASAY